MAFLQRLFYAIAMSPNSQDAKTSDSAKTPQSSDQSSNTPQLSWWKRLWRSQSENIQILAIALGLAIMIRLVIAEPRYIPSDSMLPTLQIGDRVVVEKVSYRFHHPKRGDIIVFDPPALLQEFGYTIDQAFIKRVIGEPGQTIQIQNGKVYLDNEPLQEPYIAAPPNYSLPPLTIPEGQYFVMGDNRNNSNDSHVWGFLPEENIIGRAVFRFWPLPNIGFFASSTGSMSQ